MPKPCEHEGITEAKCSSRCKLSIDIDDVIHRRTEEWFTHLEKACNCLRSNMTKKTPANQKPTEVRTPDLAETAMTPSHSRWQEFIDRLAGPEGCDFRQTDAADPRSVTWRCDSEDDTCPLSRAILADLGFMPVAIDESIQYFHDHGGFCDCEILVNLGWDE